MRMHLDHLDATTEHKNTGPRLLRACNFVLETPVTAPVHRLPKDSFDESHCAGIDCSSKAYLQTTDGSRPLAFNTSPCACYHFHFNARQTTTEPSRSLDSSQRVPNRIDKWKVRCPASLRELFLCIFVVKRSKGCIRLDSERGSRIVKRRKPSKRRDSSQTRGVAAAGPITGLESCSCPCLFR